jgi:hypothetical protein
MDMGDDRGKDPDDQKLQRLRRQFEEGRSLQRLEEERAMLSMEILEGLLLRIAAVERRLDQMEER